MPKLNAKFTHTRVLRSNGKIEACTIMSRTSEDDVMVRTTRAGTPFKAVTFLRTRNGRTIKFLQEDSTPVNLVDNPSFTSASITGWTGSAVSRVTHKFKTTPASLYVDNPDTNANATYIKTNALTIGQSYSLSFWLGGVGNLQGAVIVLYAGLASKTLIIPVRDDSTWTYYKIENVVCTGNTTLFIQFDQDYNWYLDDVSVTAGPTAV
jgi:hypothetical protein